MTRLLLVLAACLAGGCSFRPVDYVGGTLSRLSADEGAVGQPVAIRGRASFGSRYQNPALAIQPPAAGAMELRVKAVADWKGPPMDLGVFNVLPFEHDADVAGRVILTTPGIYTVTDGTLPPVSFTIR